MIPISLNLRNFMSYTDIHEPLNFDGIHVAVLSGDNGHGKSALLDAITWSLWGKSRAKGVDDLIHTGATEMEVDYEFVLDGERYRVVRKRTRRGRTGSSLLDFSVYADGKWRSLAEASLNATEAAIVRTLKMSYETFTSSSFIQQGKADAFTTNMPGERKRILAEILELGYYDELEAGAREAMRDREARVKEERVKVADYQGEVAKKPEYAAEAARLLAELQRLEVEVTALQGTCDTARERVAKLENVEQMLKAVEDRLLRQAQQLQDAGAGLADTQRRLTEARKYLVRAGEIVGAYAELTDVRQRLEAAQAAFQRYVPLATKRQAAQAALDVERATLVSRLDTAKVGYAELQPEAERAGQARKELTEAQTEQGRLQQLSQRQEALEREARTRRDEAAEKRTTNKHLRDEMDKIKARIAEVVALVTCPSCERPMDERHKARLKEKYEAEGKELAQQYRANDRTCKELEEQVRQHDAELASLHAALAARADVERRIGTAESALRRALDAGEKLQQLAVQVAADEATLRDEQFAIQARRDLADAERELKLVGYDEDLHRTLQQRHAAVAQAERDHQLLELARTRSQELAELERQHQETLRRLAEEAKADEALREQLRSESALLPQERLALQQADANLRVLRAQRDKLQSEHGQVQSKVEYCDWAQSRVTESLARQDELIREAGIYQQLANAFGKRGLQAMIIETALPEIEEEANRLLSRMTDGRMHVKLETQREARTGSGVIETLDIRISDELGTRSYEMFSGGEGFRVNFAIRVALSKLLARRAGTRLQLLVIDEGFGSQDADGRDRIVEAIQAIQGEFEKILVVTHLEDLRDRFPVRIEVQKTPRGSVISLR